MNRIAPILFALALLLTACGDSPEPENATDASVPDAAPPIPTFQECEDTEQAFVRRAHLALLGHRPKSQATVNVLADLMAAIRLRNLGPEPDPEQDAGVAPLPTPVDAKRVVAEILSRDPGFVDRWSEQLMDMLLVSRIEDQSQQSCYGDRERQDDDGSLATYVRDNPPTADGDGASFTMLDLVRSSLALDDVSPIYRAHLFALVSRAIPAANVPRVQAELARREDFGTVFDAAYLNRDMTCLGCHNSTASITFREDPATSRHWDLPGHFEEAIYGQADGIAPERAHAPFRFDGFVAFGGGSAPWGWDSSCGGFFPDGLESDPAGIDGRFASLSGNQITVYGLERSLRDGFSSIALDGLSFDDTETIADPDAAFAYLVAANIVDGIWAEIMGSRLTIANHFPRNEESRDILHQLTEEFVRSSFSIRGLVADIISTPYFNRLPAEAGCGTGPYNMPPVFDPWTIADDNDERQNNGPGDGVHPLSARTLLRSAYSALEWRSPFFEAFPERPTSINSCAQAFPSCEQLELACDNNQQCCFAEKYWCDFGPSENEPRTRAQRTFLRGVGVFLKNGDKGFRGLDFQARLVFEDRFADCRNVDNGPDFIDNLLLLASETPGATLGDLIAAIKDRLVGTARVSHEAGPSGASEKDALEAYFGAALDTPFAELVDLDGSIRGFCGTLLSTPQFLLGGMAAVESRYEPKLTPDELRYDALCESLALPAALSGHELVCTGSGLELN